MTKAWAVLVGGVWLAAALLTFGEDAPRWLVFLLAAGVGFYVNVGLTEFWRPAKLHRKAKT